MRYIATLKEDSNVILRGDACVTSLTDLYTLLVTKNCESITITREFADANFTYTSLCAFIANSAKLAPHIQITVEDTYYNNIDSAVRRLAECSSIEELIFLIERYPDKALAILKKLCLQHTSNAEALNVANNKLASALLATSDAKRLLKYRTAELDTAQANANELASKLHVLVNRLNFSYEQTINPDTMFTVGENQYKRILYLKEVSRVHYTDTLVYYLCEILKTLYSMPVRFVVIEPYYSYGRAKLYPDCKPHWELTYRDVYSGNIYMAGMQPKLMEDILCNPNQVPYLIILDRGGMDCVHVDYMNVDTIYVASDIRDLPAEADPQHAITYSKTTLNIPYIEDYESLSLEQRIQKYSTMPIVKTFIDYLEV